MSLVAIIDADKEGFLRSERSLTQTAGRAARNVNGLVIMYADVITESMQRTIDETNRRREIQLRYNAEHGITPKQIQKGKNLSVFKGSIDAYETNTGASAATNAAGKKPMPYVEQEHQISAAADPILEYMNKEQLEKSIEQTRRLMKKAAKELEFIQAAQYRDELLRLEDLLKEKFGV